MSRMKNHFAEFIGNHSIEQDGGWSFEVFQAGYESGQDEAREWMKLHAPMTYQAYLNKENL